MHAGAAIQLDARLDVLSELVNRSSAPRTTAAGTPKKIAPRKMKQSPAVTLAFVPGMRTGRMPAMTTRLPRTRSCAQRAAPRERQPDRPHAKTSAPAATTAPQQTRAARL